MTRAAAVVAAVVLTATPAAAAIPVRSTAFLPDTPNASPTHHGRNAGNRVTRTVTVKAGDTLSDLAQTWPGGPYRAAYVNDLDNPDLIEPGQRLVVPVRDGRRATPRVATPTVSRSAPAVTTPYSGSGACGGSLPTCAIMQCESGGDIHAENPTSSASGKWQIIDGTWNGYGGYARASDAPESVQDAKARQLWNGGAGRSQWVC